MAHSPFFPPQTWRPVHSPHGPSHSRSLPLLHRGPRSGPSHTPAPTPRLAPRQRPTRRPTCQRPRSLSRAPTLSATPGPRVSTLLFPSFPAPQRPPEITGEVAGIPIPQLQAEILSFAPLNHPLRAHFPILAPTAATAPQLPLHHSSAGAEPRAAVSSPLRRTTAFVESRRRSAEPPRSLPSRTGTNSARVAPVSRPEGRRR